MAKFKVGDRVKIHKPSNTSQPPGWIVEMDGYDNNIYTVENCNNNWIRVNDSTWSFHEDWLEPVFECEPVYLTALQGLKKATNENPKKIRFNRYEPESFNLHTRLQNFYCHFKLSELTKGNKMRNLSELSAKIRRTFNKDQKALWKAGYIDECGRWTDKAHEEAMNLACDNSKEELVKFANEEIELSKEESNQ